MRYCSLFLVVVVALEAAVANGQVRQAEDKAPDMKKSAQTIDGKTMYDWMKDLKDSRDPGVRVRAIHALQFYGKDARETIPHIVKALNDRDASVRVNAAIAVGLIGFDAQQLSDGINALIRLVSSDSQGIVRYQ